ncbi:MAG TPA: thiamine pyrophosphate-dependent enzyme, partial [bacterium]
RNIDITLIVVNNFIYVMTGGQHSPTTPSGSYGTTAPYGNIDPSFDVCRVADGAGATFVARTTSYHTAQTEQLVEKAVKHKGFSVVDVITGCPVYYGRKNKFKTPTEMLLWQKETALPLKAAEKMKPEQIQGKILTGIFVEKTLPEYTERYAAMVQQIKARA